MSLLEYASKRAGFIENSGKVMLCQVIADRRFGERLYNKEWWSVDFTGTNAIPQFTSDRAVTCLGSGIDDPNGLIMLPLSPSIVLYICNTEVKSRYQSLGRGRLGLETMKAIATNARMFAYGTRQSNRNVIDKYLPRR
jgi:hypothetical protein